MEEKDRVIKPKPKLTKAERREKQERERAAKASAREQGQQPGGGPGSLPGVKQANASTPSGRPAPEAGQVVTS